MLLGTRSAEGLRFAPLLYRLLLLDLLLEVLRVLSLPLRPRCALCKRRGSVRYTSVRGISIRNASVRATLPLTVRDTARGRDGDSDDAARGCLSIYLSIYLSICLCVSMNQPLPIEKTEVLVTFYKSCRKSLARKPRPEAGRDCLMCTTIARQRVDDEDRLPHKDSRLECNKTEEEG